MKKSFILEDSEETEEKKKYGKGIGELKKAMRIQRSHEENKHRSYSSFRFWQSLVVQNVDLFCTTFLELNGLLFLYPLHTVKTRIQSQHKSQDIAFFLKNQVGKQPVYSGIGYGLLANVVSNVMMYSVYQLGQLKLEEYPSLGLFEKKLCAFLLADMMATPFRMTLDTHKQLLQMSAKDTKLSTILSKSRLAFLPTLLRELTFRASFLSLYHFSLFGLEDPSQITPSATQRYNSLTGATLVALALSNPFDVLATKLTTQQIDKYTGMSQCLSTVVREEGSLKLFSSGLWPRTMYFTLNATLFFHLYELFRNTSLEAFQLQ